MLEWHQPRFEQIITSDRWITESVCGNYRIAKSHIRYGSNSENPIPDVCYAMELRNNAWNIISRHRQETAAQKACDRRANQRKREAKAAAKLALQQRKRRLK